VRIGSGPFTNLDWLYELRNGRAFGQQGSSGPSVGNLSHVQLLNPAASGVTIILHRIYYRAAAAALLRTNFFNTALSGAPVAGVNLNNGGAAGLGVVRTEDNAAEQGTRFRLLGRPADDTGAPSEEWICVLGAGEGVLVVPSGTNLGISISWEWVEF